MAVAPVMRKAELLKMNLSTSNAIALWKKRCGMDQKQLIM